MNQMNNNELFAAALELKGPWYVRYIVFTPEKKRIKAVDEVRREESLKIPFNKYG